MGTRLAHCHLGERETDLVTVAVVQLLPRPWPVASLRRGLRAKGDAKRERSCGGQGREDSCRLHKMPLAVWHQRPIRIGAASWAARGGSQLRSELRAPPGTRGWREGKASRPNENPTSEP